MASVSELAENSDNCAICWEKMESARKLPCTHLFHNSCLQSWLEQDTSCPTCRRALNMQSNHRENTPEIPTESQTPVRRNDNHFFHFDGSRYVSWLPSFSVEVSHNRLRGGLLISANSNSQLDAMARQVIRERERERERKKRFFYKKTCQSQNLLSGKMCVCVCGDKRITQDV